MKFLKVTDEQSDSLIWICLDKLVALADNSSFPESNPSTLIHTLSHEDFFVKETLPEIFQQIKDLEYADVRRT